MQTSLRFVPSLVIAVSLLTFSACGSDQEPPGEALAEKADEVAWAEDTGRQITCNDWVFGYFDGTALGHGYAMNVQSGHVYSFEMTGTYTPTYGAGIAVYNAVTQELLDYEVVEWSNQATLDFTPTASGDVEVALFTAVAGVAGAYTLQVDCYVTNLPLCSPTPPDYGCYYACDNGYYIGSWGVTCGCC